MTGEAVLGMTAVQLGHLGITGHLGEDGGGADGGHQAVALDHGARLHRQCRAAVAVDKDQLGCHGEARHGALHGQHGGVQYIELVDLIRGGAAYGPGQGLCLDLAIQGEALLLGELLGVGEAFNGIGGIQDHRGGDHVTHQGATAHLVNPCYQLVLWNIDRHITGLESKPAPQGQYQHNITPKARRQPP